MTSSGIIYRCRGCGHTYRESSPYVAPYLSHMHVYRDEVVALVLAGWTIKEVWCLECDTRHAKTCA
jgi:hypothetical protein